MSLGVVEAFTGRTSEALATFDEAEHSLDGIEAARVVFQRSSIHYRLGNYDEALALMNQCLPIFEQADDVRHMAHTRSNRGVVLGYIGDLKRARHDLERARGLYRALDFSSAGAVVVHNLGWVAVRSGDLAHGLRLFDEAATELERLDRPSPELSLDRCEALIAAGCPQEARPIARFAANELAGNGNLLEAAEAHLMEAGVALECGDGAGAHDAAAHATRLFVDHDRPVWAAVAEATLLHARWLTGSMEPDDLNRLVARAEALHEANQVFAARNAFLVAGRVSLAWGDVDRAADLLDRIAAARAEGPVEMRLQAWLATALVRLARDDRRGAAAAATAGVRLLTTYQAALGGLDVRALIGVHASELFDIGLDLAYRSRRIPRIFSWAERSRARAVRYPPVQPPDDDQLAEDLEELRRISHRIREAEADDRSAVAARSQQRRTQDRVVERMRRTSGGGADQAIPLADLVALRAELGDRTLVEFVVIGDRRVAIVVTDSRSRLVDVGAAGDVNASILALRKRLRRLAVRPPSASNETLLRSIRSGAAELDDALLATIGLEFGAGDAAETELVIIPSSDLEGLPWSLLSQPRGRPLVVAPSASSWLATQQRSTIDRERPDVVVVGGPDIELATEEVQRVADVYGDCRTLIGPAATAADVCGALDGCDIAHVVAHGSVATENPLFSSLRLNDGPLFAYDLQRLRRPPKLLVLSACNVGATQEIAPGEAMGMASVFLAMGTRTVVATAGLLRDSDNTIRVAEEIHRRHRAGSSVAAAVYAAQNEADRRGAPVSIDCLGGG